MNIVYYKDPPETMPHIWDKVPVPVVAQVLLCEPEPTAEEIAAARARTPAKMKLFGNSFVKKPEEVPFYFFNSFFKDTYHAISSFSRELPVQYADSVIRQIEKRIPYENASVDRYEVQAFLDLLKKAIKMINAEQLNGTELPEAMYTCYQTTDIKSEPYGAADDLLRQTKCQYVFMQTDIGQKKQENFYLCYRFDFTFYVIRAGKAWTLLRTVPAFERT